MATFYLKYDKGLKKLNINEQNFMGMITPNASGAKCQSEQELRAALENPIHSKRLRDIVKLGETVVIVTSDITRPMPSKEVLPMIIEELELGGIKAEDITVVFALGSHRKHTEEEKRYLAGDSVIAKGVRLIDNDMEDCINFGVCKNGTPVDIYRPVAEADRLICLGNIEYHYFAGYSGGAKALMPGVSSKRAIQINHSMMTCERATAGNLQNNPVREDIDEVGEHIKIDFIFNVVLDDNKKIIKAFAGHYLEAHRAGCRFLDEIYSVRIQEEADIVVVSAGGYPKDINMYQAQKALDNARIAVRQGGIIIWCASMTEGFGSESFEKWILGKTQDQMFADITRKFELGGHKAVAIATTMKKAKLFVVSEMDASILKKINMVPFDTIQKAYEKAIEDLGEEAKTLIMPIGGSALPIKTQVDSLIYNKMNQGERKQRIDFEPEGGSKTMKRSYDKKISDYIDEHQQELIALLQECVRIPSVTGDEGPIQAWMESRFRELNLDTFSFEADYNIVSKHPAFIDSGIPFKGRPNVIGLWKGKESARSLTINGHCDVVSPEPVTAWKKDPWGAEIEDGRLYGRGALDMKGGFIAGLFAVKALQALGLKPEGTVILESVIEEEAGAGGGTLACMMQQGILSDAFIALEPQGPRITYCHAGVLYFRIKVQGKTMHAGMAHEGVNAIGKILKIYEALVDLNSRRHQEISFEPFEIGSGKATNLNVGTLRAGDWPSSVAGFAAMECRIGFVPGETETGVREMIEALVCEVADKDEWMKEHRPTVEWFGWHAEPWYQDPNAEFPQSFRQTMKRYYGEEPVFMGRGSGNDARFTSYFGGQGICSGCTGGGLHGIDEYVDLSSVVNTSKVIAMSILDWCGLQD